MNRKSVTTADSQSTEFVYRIYSPFDGQFPDEWVIHRIVKRTAKRVYVAPLPWRPGRRDIHVYDNKAKYLILDRQKLETHGEVYHRHNIYHTAIPDGYIVDYEELHRTGSCLVERLYEVMPHYMTILGIDPTSTPDEIRRAYRRKVRETHPDMGGNADDFRQVQAAYEQAMERHCPA
jgi:hypothetical protein